MYNKIYNSKEKVIIINNKILTIAIKIIMSKINKV